MVDLTTPELDVLLVLDNHQGLALSKELLLDQVRGLDCYGDIRVVDVHIG